jgi:hypothetical protein
MLVFFFGLGTPKNYGVSYQMKGLQKAKKNLREATQSAANSQDPSTSYAMIYTRFGQGSYTFWVNNKIWGVSWAILSMKGASLKVGDV